VVSIDRRNTLTRISQMICQFDDVPGGPFPF